MGFAIILAVVIVIGAFIAFGYSRNKKKPSKTKQEAFRSGQDVREGKTGDL